MTDFSTFSDSFPSLSVILGNRNSSSNYSEQGKQDVCPLDLDIKHRKATQPSKTEKCSCQIIQPVKNMSSNLKHKTNKKEPNYIIDKRNTILKHDRTEPRQLGSSRRQSYLILTKTSSKARKNIKRLSSSCYEVYSEETTSTKKARYNDSRSLTFNKKCRQAHSSYYASESLSTYRKHTTATSLFSSLTRKTISDFNDSHGSFFDIHSKTYHTINPAKGNAHWNYKVSLLDPQVYCLKNKNVSNIENIASKQIEKYYRKRSVPSQSFYPSNSLESNLSWKSAKSYSYKSYRKEKPPSNSSLKTLYSSKSNICKWNEDVIRGVNQNKVNLSKREPLFRDRVTNIHQTYNYCHRRRPTKSRRSLTSSVKLTNITNNSGRVGFHRCPCISRDFSRKKTVSLNGHNNSEQQSDQITNIDGNDVTYRLLRDQSQSMLQDDFEDIIYRDHDNANQILKSVISKSSYNPSYPFDETNHDLEDKYSYTNFSESGMGFSSDLHSQSNGEFNYKNLTDTDDVLPLNYQVTEEDNQYVEDNYSSNPASDYQQQNSDSIMKKRRDQKHHISQKMDKAFMAISLAVIYIPVLYFVVSLMVKLDGAIHNKSSVVNKSESRHDLKSIIKPEESILPNSIHNPKQPMQHQKENKQALPSTNKHGDKRYDKEFEKRNNYENQAEEMENKEDSQLGMRTSKKRRMSSFWEGKEDENVDNKDKCNEEVEDKEEEDQEEEQEEEDDDEEEEEEEKGDLDTPSIAEHRVGKNGRKVSNTYNWKYQDSTKRGNKYLNKIIRRNEEIVYNTGYQGDIDDVLPPPPPRELPAPSRPRRHAHTPPPTAHITPDAQPSIDDSDDHGKAPGDQRG